MIRLSLLGSLDLRAGDGRQMLSVLAQPKRVALLAYLAANRDYVRRDTLLGLFWPESDAEHARHALRQSVYTLRRSLGPRTLASRGDEELAIDSDHLECDVAAFETAVRDGRAEAALELYKGDLLEGFFLSDAPEFEKWLDGRRTTLRNQAAEAAWAIAQTAEETGQPTKAAKWARRATDYAPDEESSVQRLMGLLDRVGDRAAALRAYEAFAWRLDNELGLQPSPETQTLVSEIRARQEAVTRSGEAEASRAHSDAARARTQPVDGEWSLPDESLLEGAPTDTSKFEPAAAEVSGETTATRLQGSTADGSSEAIAAGAETPEDEPKKHGVRLGIAVAALAAAAVIVDFAEIVQFVASWFSRDDTSPAATGSPASFSGADLDPHRIAVLYFDDHSENQKLAHLANGLTEGLIQQLNDVDALDVISRNGVKPFRYADVTVDSIVKVLHPGTIVEGSVMGAGDRIRVTVQLIDAGRNSQLGSRTINRAESDLFQLLDAVASEVSFFLRDRLGKEIRLRQLQAGTENPEAWSLVQQADLSADQGDWLRARGDTIAAAELYTRADSQLVEAGRLDSKWQIPILERGWIAIRQAKRIAGAPEAYDPDWLAAGIAHAEHALEISPRHPKALELRGTAYAWLGRAGKDMDQATAFELAEEDLKAAVELDPELARAWGALAELYLYQARFGEARFAINQALAKDAFLEDATRIYLYAGSLAMEERDLAEALSWTNEGLNRFPNKRGFAGLRLMILASETAYTDAMIQQGWEALRLLEAVEGPEKWPAHQLKMAIVLAAAGLSDSARNVIQRARDADTEDPLAHYYEAKARLNLGEREEAIRLLAQLIDGLPGFTTYLATDWWFEALFDDPAFQELVAEKG